MYREIAHNESSGNEIAGTRVKTKPTAIELTNVNLADTRRDSGCFTESPFSGASTNRSLTQFPFEASSPNSSSLQEASAAPGDYFESAPRDDTDEEMFVMSCEDDIFLDSGIGRDEDTPQPVSQRISPVYRQSPLATQSRMAEISNDSDDDSSTEEEEFSTAEMEPRSSPISFPIPIPRTGSPLRHSDPEPQVSSLPSRTHASEPSPPLEPVFRLHGNYLLDRPSSGNARLENVQSLPHAAGSLPDVVPIDRRSRAYSEGVLYTRPDAEAIGTSLRDICDDFSRQHVNKQQAKNQIEQLRANQVRMRQRPRRPLPHSASMPEAPGNIEADQEELGGNRRSGLYNLVQKYF